MKLAALAVLLLASGVRAAGVVYEHPALKVRLTVLTAEGDSAPDALAYEGPKGFYLITAAELHSFEHTDGWSGFEMDVRRLTPTEYSRRRQPYEDPFSCRYADDACVAPIEEIIGELRSSGKHEAPDEFALRSAQLADQAAAAAAQWRSEETEAASGAISDKDALDALEQPLAAAAAKVAAVRALRVGGEYRACVAVPTAVDPDPRADFYWRQGRALDAAAASLAETERVMSSERISAY
jgi:hypothetical protein